MESRCIHEYALSTGTGSKTGASALTSELWPHLDLSGFQALLIRVSLTTADTDAIDVLDIALQETYDGTVWSDRARMPNFIGTLSPSAGSPEVYIQTIRRALDDLSASEESLEPSGSAGGSRLPVDTVRNGPFAPRLRAAAGPSAAYRLYIEVTDADSDASFVGTIQVFGIC